MMDRDAIVATFARASADADIAVIEGMMGLFDSATPNGDEGGPPRSPNGWMRP